MLNLLIVKKTDKIILLARKLRKSGVYLRIWDGEKDYEGGDCGEQVDGQYTGTYERTCVEGKWEKGDCILTGYKSETCDIGKIECKVGVAFINGRRFEDCQDCWETTPSGTNCVLNSPSYTCGGCSITCP